MNDLQAAEIIEKVFKAHWPNWNFDVEETAVWVHELRKYDYGRAKSVINNFYMAQTKQGKPAPAHLRRALRNNARIQQKKQSNEPVLLFEIIKEGRERGQFFSQNPPLPADQEIEEYAERGRKAFNNMYGGNHIVVRHWEKDEIPF